MKKGICILILMMCLFRSIAGVDLRTGLFYITYSDMEFNNSKAELSRNYNSGHNKVGLFGHGWNSFIETNLSALPDGSIILNWWGNTLGDYYEPANVDKKGLYDMVNNIIANLVQHNKLENNPVAIAEKKAYFLVNNKERAQKYIELQQAHLDRIFIPAAGKKLTWILDVNQSITWNGKFYEVKSWDDHFAFNERGQLTVINDRSYTMELFYFNNKLSKLLIDHKDTCLVTIDSSGKITRLSYENGVVKKQAVFHYDKDNNLLYSRDAGDNEYWYAYDFYHNMQRIDYADSSFVSMTYDAATNRCIKFRDRNGSYSTYEYPYFFTADGKINKLHYATKFKKFDSANNIIFTQYREFESRIREDGSSYHYHILEQNDTLYSEIFYSPEVGNAVYRKKNSKEAWAAYDLKKRPSYLHINDSIYKSAYNMLNLPEYFLAMDSLRHDSSQYRYFYNKDDELIKVRKNDFTYFINGNKTGDSVEIKRENGNYLIIRFLNKLPISIENKEWGSTLIDSVTDETGNENKQHLLEIYREFKDVMEPKKIAHEWIWERM